MKALKSILMALVVLLLPVVAFGQAEPPVVNPYGRFLVGDGVEVEMAQFGQKNQSGLYDVLLRIGGRRAFDEGIDGKTFKYEAVNAGTGIDYRYQGKTRMIVRQPYGDWWTLIEVFLDGKTIALREDSKRSKDVLPRHLQTAWEAGK